MTMPRPGLLPSCALAMLLLAPAPGLPAPPWAQPAASAHAPSENPAASPRQPAAGDPVAKQAAPAGEPATRPAAPTGDPATQPSPPAGEPAPGEQTTAPDRPARINVLFAHPAAKQAAPAGEPATRPATRPAAPTGDPATPPSPPAGEPAPGEQATAPDRPARINVLFAPLRLDKGIRSHERLLRARLAAGMLRTGRFAETATAETERQVQECVRTVNRDVNEETCWIRLGQGQGAQVLVHGEVLGSERSCSVLLRLVELETRISPRLHVADLKPCGDGELKAEMDRAALILAGPEGRSGDREAHLAAETSPGGATHVDPARPAGDGLGRGLEWVPLPGGSFAMGAGDGGEEERPVHTVQVRPFELMRTEVTVAMYRNCVGEGRCSPAHDDDGQCRIWSARRGWVPGVLPASFRGEQQPVTCVDWEQARAFCAAAGGRLPSEAEWEYAARSGGRHEFPWGDAEPRCDRAVMDDRSGSACGREATWPVCSRPAGNSLHGICDLAGNVWEWTQDSGFGSYQGAPADGSARQEAQSPTRVNRGGGWGDQAHALRAAQRNWDVPGHASASLGFRCAR